MSTIIVYTDGSCSGNPGPGGWAATLNFVDRFDLLSGYETKTTNNRMELKAVTSALEYLYKKGHRNIIIKSDSAYVVNAINKGWINEWHYRKWHSKQGNPIANQDLWCDLYSILSKKGFKVFFQKIAGHAGHTFNEIADQEAKREAEYAKRLVRGGQNGNNQKSL